MVEAVLVVEGLEKRYPNGRGVGPLDLVFEPGIHGLLGPNGSGKTTLLKTLLGFLRPTAGRAQVFGRDIVREPLLVRRHVGYMAENDVLVPGLNAMQTVRLAAELCGLSRARAFEAASEALQAVGLGEEALHAPERLSTGQRQKMKLAAALVHAPRLLLLDEPTNGLDPRARTTMLALIKEVARERAISVVLSTHILPDVEAVCDDAVVLREGLLAGTEQVRGRTVQREGRTTWFDITVLGDPAPFVAACGRSRLRVAEGDALRVAAPDVARVLAVAKRCDAVLLRVEPATRGVEDAVLAHLEGP